MYSGLDRMILQVMRSNTMCYANLESFYNCCRKFLLSFGQLRTTEFKPYFAGIIPSKLEKKFNFKMALKEYASNNDIKFE